MIYEAAVQRLRADVAAMATPEGRMVGSVGHERARQFLDKRMSSLGLEPYNGADGYALPYQHGGQDFFNPVGVLPGADRQARPVLLGAQFDAFLPMLLQRAGVQKLRGGADLDILIRSLCNFRL